MAAKKNPKRVAAGKKAARTRAKGKRRGGGGRRKNNRRKPVQRGITGRIGAVILGVLPPAISGLEAAGTAMAMKKTRSLSGFGTLQFGLYRWLNNLSNGFLGTIPFPDADLPQEGGTITPVSISAGLPKGSLWSVAGVGILMMVYDAIAAKLAGGRPVKIPFTGMNATGGS